MDIDITNLSDAELVALNREIVEEIRYRQEAQAYLDMLEFDVGDRVTFVPKGRTTQVGEVVRLNKKTVSVVTDEGATWNVAPSLLRRIVEAGSPGSAGATELSQDG